MRRLLIRPGGIGDVIVSLPALEYLKADYTEVWVPSATVPLIQFADRVVSIASSRIDMLTDGFVERFRQFDEVHSWYGSNKEELLAINRNCHFYRLLGEGDEHACDVCLKQVGGPLGLRPKIRVKNVARETIAIHPFSGSHKKNWAYENFFELAERLPLPVEWAQDRFGNLLELGEWIAGARLYIGNDSGITHLAGAVGAPVLAIFMQSEPKIWAPDRAKVLRNPSVDEVLEAANELRRRRAAHGFEEICESSR
jgi:ADP-heptose:LPS heptosyltransferase